MHTQTRKTTQRFLLCSLMTSLPLAAQAAETNFSYTQLNFSLMQTHLDEPVQIVNHSADTLRGIDFGGSVNFHENAFLGVQINAVGKTFGNSDEQVSQSERFYYLGMAVPMNNSIDLGARLGVGSASYKTCFANNTCNDSSTNLSKLNLFARFWLNDRVELNTDFTHTNYEKQAYDTDSAVSLGAAFYLTKKGALTAKYTKGDDANRFQIGYQYSMGNGSK